MQLLFRKPRAERTEPPPAAAAPDLQQAVVAISKHASLLGLIDDSHHVNQQQTEALQRLNSRLAEVQRAQADIGSTTASSLASVERARAVVGDVAGEVGRIVETLRRVTDAAEQITQIALQTRLVAFNASVEAGRAGEAGRGFAIVADAVKALSGQVETSSKHIIGTVAELDARVARLAQDIQPPAHGDAVHVGATSQGAFHRALAEVEGGVGSIGTAAAQSRTICDGLVAQMQQIDREMQCASRSLTSANARSEGFLKLGEQLIEVVADCGIDTDDTPYIRAAQDAAAQVAQLLDHALQSGLIDQAGLFDENYQPLPGTAPAQHTTRFVALADRLFPPVQEAALALSPKVVYCIAVDRNGYVPTHNERYCKPQRAGDLAWNTANSRYRRVFDDRTGLASARNQRPFLLQTYRRDMGGGQFVVMKEAAAPVTVAGRHWGAVRLAFQF